MSQVDVYLKSASAQYQNILKITGDGVEIPKLTTAQRLALSLGSPDAGITVWDTTSSAMFSWTGTGWTSTTGASYSDGTWVATFVPATGSITLDPANKTGRWAKVGNLVTVSLHAKVQSISSPTGALIIDNLPFPIAVGFEGSVSAAVTGLNNGARTSIVGTITGSGINMYRYDSGLFDVMGPHVLVNSEWYITGSYFT